MSSPDGPDSRNFPKMTTLILILTSMTGVILTFFVSHHLHQGPVRASAGLSLLAGLIFYLFPDMVPSEIQQTLPFVFIGSSFIGMVSAEILDNYLLLAVAGLIYSIIFLNASRFFTGFGGAMGTAACVSLLATIGLSHLGSKTRRK